MRNIVDGKMTLGISLGAKCFLPECYDTVLNFDRFCGKEGTVLRLRDKYKLKHKSDKDG